MNQKDYVAQSVVLFGSIARKNSRKTPEHEGTLTNSNDLDILIIGDKNYDSKRTKSCGKINIHHCSIDYLFGRANRQDLFVMHLIKEGLWLNDPLNFKSKLSLAFHVTHWPEKAMLTTVEQIVFLNAKLIELQIKNNESDYKLMQSCSYNLLYRFAQYVYFQRYKEIIFDKEKLQYNLGTLIKKYEIHSMKDLIPSWRRLIKASLKDNSFYKYMMLQNNDTNLDTPNDKLKNIIKDEKFFREIGFGYTVYEGMKVL